MRSTVRDVMTTRVVAVRKDASFKEMIARMRTARISAFPVVDQGGKVVGVVSEADLLNKEADQATSPGTIAGLLHFRFHEKAAGVAAGELMTSPAVTIGPDVPVTEAARVMRDRRVKRLPVVDADGRLAGIVSRMDVLSVYERPDGQIRGEVATGVIAGRFLLDPLDFDVSVESGIVTIAGCAESRAVALTLIAAIRNVEGTVAVRDRLSYPRT
jgi:CBS domain-containing protein